MVRVEPTLQETLHAVAAASAHVAAIMAGAVIVSCTVGWATVTLEPANWSGSSRVLRIPVD